MSYFATAYTIHFDDTMAYGSHHFLTGFKFQCAAREAFLFGDQIFDLPGVKQALDGVHLLTADAYSRNLSPARLGDRLAILLSLEEWGRSSARFCYRVLAADGRPVSAGFQTLICADAQTQLPQPLPPPLAEAMQAMRAIEEPPASPNFRDRVLAGGSKLEALFGPSQRQLAQQFLADRYPRPKIVSAPPLPATQSATRASPAIDHQPAIDQLAALPSLASPPPADAADVTIKDTAGDAAKEEVEAWVFAGQAAFDAELLVRRVQHWQQHSTAAAAELQQAIAVAEAHMGGDAQALLAGSVERVRAAVAATPALAQVAIHLQNVLGARTRQAAGFSPGHLVGHSFGEIAALAVAGCFDLATGVQIIALRMLAIDDHAPPGGGLLVVGCDVPRGRLECCRADVQRVVVAGRNHASQTLLSGPLAELERLKEHLRGSQLAAVLIDSPTAFHHPDLRVAASVWRTALRGLDLRPPVLPVYSLINRQWIATTDDLAGVLAAQFVRPYDLQAGVEDLVLSGVTRFVDCGSSGSLRRLLAKSVAAGVSTCGVDDPRALPVAEQGRASEVAASPRPPIAIVGQGCLLPGGANSPQELFAAIAQRRVGIVDQRRFDPHWSDDFYSERLMPDRSNSHLAGRVNDSDLTAPPGVDPHIFEGFTRTQKLLCLALAPCLPALAGAERVLCLVGATADGFEDQDEVSALRYAGIEPAADDFPWAWATPQSLRDTPHAAVQAVFDRLVRPGLQVMLVDAACASSLYAVSLGMHALETYQTDAVVAGGVFCPGPGNSCLFSQFRGTTATGCRPFDAGADGVVFSEGAALVTLRRRSDAQQLGLDIQATLLGAGLSSDGKSPSANVPQTRGQILSLQRCYASYGIDPASISAIEGHGTSTPVGDGTELETLRQFFAGRVAAPLPVHSLKGLLGHAGWAAGTASIIAVCEYLRRRTFPAQAMFQQPSAALLKSQGTLMIPDQNVSLTNPRPRIAIDGFGFGGANAHVVLEAYDNSAARAPAAVPVVDSPSLTADDELVFVAACQQQPTQVCVTGRRFDRHQVRLPASCVVLPELADDMDISQILATRLTEQIASQVPEFDARLRKETSLVVALSGKTERGIEATLRIMSRRFRRLLAGDERLLTQIDAAHHASRPSATYTLQNMMPNVAAGRAALLMNLHGPNYVVDAGCQSLAAALTSAQLWLGSGPAEEPRLAIVASIDASSRRFPEGFCGQVADEHAAAFALTTRRWAAAHGLPVLASVKEALQAAEIDLHATQATLPTALQVQRLLAAVTPEPAAAMPAAAQPAAAMPAVENNSDTRMYAPAWVEKPLPAAEESPRPIAAAVIVVPAECEQVAEIYWQWSERAERCLVVLVGGGSQPRPAEAFREHVLTVDPLEEQSVVQALQRIAAMHADMLVVVDTTTTWHPTSVLTQVSSDNRLGEFLFLASQQATDRLHSGQLELWGLCVDGWNGQVVHPQSGALAGLLKSIQREFPAARTGQLCTRGLSPSAAIDCLLAERATQPGESEIIYDHQSRLVRRLRPVAQQPDAAPAVELGRHAVVVATGGAKGVTAVMLEALLRDYQCTVVAIGRSPLEAGPENFDQPQAEQAYYAQLLRERPGASAAELKKCFESARSRWEAERTIKQLGQLGGHIEYVAADVTDAQQMAAVLQQIAARYGRIDLLVHGAGIQKSKRLEHRSLDDFRQVFGTKLRGLANLVQSCQAAVGYVPGVHVLTSAYSIFGNDGQHDYGAANETLDRLCGLYQAVDHRPWTSLAWLAWDGVGMTRGTEYRALAKNRRLSGITPALGARLFRDVIAGRTGAAVNVPMTTAEQVQYRVRTIPPAQPAAQGRMQGRVREVDVQLSAIGCLPFHKVRNTPTLPGAWILDLFVATGRQLAPQAERAHSVTLRDVTFGRFVRFADNREPNLRVVAEQRGEGIDLWLVADVLHPSGATLAQDVVCASAYLAFDGDKHRPAACVIEACPPQALSHAVRDPYCAARSDVALSGMFECLTDIHIQAAGRRAKFNTPAGHASANHIPALLLDAAWRVGAMYAKADDPDLFVPVKIGRLRLPLLPSLEHSAAAWEIRSTAPKSENRMVRWDRTEVVDEAGHLRLLVEDAAAVRLN